MGPIALYPLDLGGGFGAMGVAPGWHWGGSMVE